MVATSLRRLRAVEFADVVRRRHMVRRFDDRPLPRAILDEVLDAGLRAPSAGFTQGTSFVVLEGAAETAPFWRLTARPGGVDPVPGGRREGMHAAPAIVLPLSDKEAYLARYAEPDKRGLGLEDEDRWPVPYWDVDAAFAAMAVLLAATSAGLGAVFFGIFHGERALLDHLGVPPAMRAIGAIAIGWPAPSDHRSPSLARGRRARGERVHYGCW
jgi:nitroreductase